MRTDDDSQEKSLPGKLHELALNRIINRFELQEVTGADGGPYLSFSCKAPFALGTDVGHMRLFRGDPLFQVATATIVVPEIQLDSHMIFAFTPSDSAVPHFTVDSVCADGHYAFHLDLIPRLDLGVHLQYMNEVFQPLTDACVTGRAIDGLSRAELSPRQWAIMSPWMLANRATVEAFRQIDATVLQFQDHWFALLENGISATALENVTAGALLERDKRNKAIIFNAEVDPVWQKITPLLGPEMVNKLMAVLRATSEISN